MDSSQAADGGLRLDLALRRGLGGHAERSVEHWAAALVLEDDGAEGSRVLGHA
jgi:hypothetical protein